VGIRSKDRAWRSAFGTIEDWNCLCQRFDNAGQVIFRDDLILEQFMVRRNHQTSVYVKDLEKEFDFSLQVKYYFPWESTSAFTEAHLF
jgi:hypothetical protein